MIVCTLLSDRGVKYCSLKFEDEKSAKKWGEKMLQSQPEGYQFCLIQDGIEIHKSVPKSL